MPRTSISILLKQNVKPSDLVPLTIVDDTVLFVTEKVTGVEEITFISNATSVPSRNNTELRGPRLGVEFSQGGANRILSASFVVGNTSPNLPAVSVLPAIQVQ